jgi:hypothetical protein
VNHDISSFKHHVPDEMVETFVALGSITDVAEKLEPLWSVADHLCPTPLLWNCAMGVFRELSKLSPKWQA